MKSGCALQPHEVGFTGDHTLDAQRFLYRGYMWDDALKMYHVRHRVYDPSRMVWLQRDPLGRMPGSNEYAYCLGEPVDFYDPMGLEGDDISDLQDQLRRVPGDADTNMGATAEQQRRMQEAAEQANRDFETAGEVGRGLASMVPVLGEIDDVYTLRDSTASTRDRTLSGLSLFANFLVPILPNYSSLKGAKRITIAVEEASDAGKATDNAVDAAKAGENAKDAAKATDKAVDAGDCAKQYKKYTKENFRENLGIERGNPLTKGKQEAHHIIPQGDRRGAEARDKLKEIGIDVHDPANGAVLTIEQHKRIHSKENADTYYQRVTEALRDVKTRDEAIKELRRIGETLEKGNLP